MIFEYSMSGKWLELLKQIVPRLSRAAVLRDSANPAGIAQFGAIRATGASLGGIELHRSAVPLAGQKRVIFNDGSFKVY